MEETAWAVASADGADEADEHAPSNKHCYSIQFEVESIMKIVITTVSPGIDAQVDPRFGRGAYFLLVDSDTLEWQAEANPAIDASGGAGVQAAQLVAQRGAQVAISGDFGPNAYEALTAAGIQMYLAPAGESLTASELLARYQRGGLKQVTAPTGPGHHRPGVGRRRGQGRGRQ
ncbi:MAG: hypothetical protein Kow0063_07810 [Anaerolineae bacterium]